MHYTEPKVHLIAYPQIDWWNLREYMVSVGAEDWFDTQVEDDYAHAAEILIETAGRICYRSWKPGLNPNVTKVRDDRGEYFDNIMKSAHGSVLEHAQFSFIFQNVSRVLTHELARHRAGTAISQESLRFVRLEDIPFFMPEWAQQDDYMMGKMDSFLQISQNFQQEMAAWFDLDNPETTFKEKKEKTSFMRRFAPEGLTTDLIWSANIRTLRHVIDVRTDHGAEEEIRLVFGQVYEVMQKTVPLLFQDFINDGGHYQPLYRKV